MAFMRDASRCVFLGDSGLYIRYKCQKKESMLPVLYVSWRVMCVFVSFNFLLCLG
jgi:hypothetical protein